jgi:CRP/FNR family transcriptional regulator, cyclic AMP receptor protein
MAAVSGGRGPSFRDALAPAQLAALQALGGRRRYRAGTTLFHERDPGDAVLLVLRGRVKISVPTASGREALLDVREPGELIGEMAALGGVARSATVTAVEPVEVLAVAQDAFMAYLDHTPGVAVVLLRMLARRLVEADRKLVEFVAQDTVGRVCGRLVDLAERFGEPAPDGVLIHGPVTQEELAGWTGASREALVKALRVLRERGWIATGRGEITVLDAEALRRRAGLAG